MFTIKQIGNFILQKTKTLWGFISTLSVGIFFLMGFEYCTLLVFDRTPPVYLSVIYGGCVFMHFLNKKKRQCEEILDEIEKWDKKYNNNLYDSKNADIQILLRRNEELREIIRSRIDH